ncbi:MAG: undecaprenyl-diphosphate phosphatase [Parachlamydiaceae bacterium]|nr:undecaprenyl-diphosphate phosphatase [Parachlamydiaceae bacterium]
MSTIQAFILGIIQGLTEFFPISSSGHLQLGQYFLGLTNLEHYILFDLICHLGTLFALVIVFAQNIRNLFAGDRTRLQQVILGTLPLFPLVLLMKPIKALFDQPQYIGYCFLFTALLLSLGIRAQHKQIQPSNRPWRDALYIGMFQAVAILPGISRSGSTISGAQMIGWKRQDAISFSFLLAIPAILGGLTLETLKLLQTGSSASTHIPSVGFLQYFTGFLTSFVMGYFALQWLIKLAAKDKFVYFVWYCGIIGIASILYFANS